MIQRVVQWMLKRMLHKKQTRSLDLSRLSQFLLILLKSRSKMTFLRNPQRLIKLFKQMLKVLLKLLLKEEREVILKMINRRSLKKCNKMSKIWSNLSKQLITIELTGKRKRPMKSTKKNRRRRMRKLIRNSERKMRNLNSKKKNSKIRLLTKKKKSSK